MPLRVTPGMMHMQLTRNLNNNLTQMQSIQNQVTTGRTINKPSDDPVGITYALRYRTELSGNEQYQKNVDQALSWLDFNDTVLAQTGDVLQRVKELTVQGSNGTNPAEALENIKKEIEQLKSQLIDVANSKMNGKYVFNGQKFDSIPYDVSSAGFDAKAVQSDTEPVDYIVGAGVKLTVNIPGASVFGDPDAAGTTDNIFSTLDRLITALGTTNHNAVAAEVTNIESRMSKVLNARAEVGARVNRIELMQNRLNDLEINLTALQSKVEDADFEELLIKSKVNENIYQASLSVGAKVISPSLIDFLR
ncbi:flagellar biosynthesis protein FlgL [Paenibacillus sambharensis]|uniref:Flagellar biosynthesis protein FlgL n=1 Tax=Paenibacillus sambharensis TaxID=1803190 RepID=A0A2W1LST6_9BACL|nr:flagellar hook-associated protein FlgL [Paenibacillus sambharensis]PZD97835.1 flagellar biosynthesis protein FlgL [Paenibacillus sambharensis]